MGYHTTFKLVQIERAITYLRNYVATPVLSYLINSPFATQCCVDDASQPYCLWTCTMFYETLSVP